MTIVLWRALAAAFGLLLSIVFLVTGFFFEAIITSCATTLWFLSHAGVPETLGVRFLHRKAELEFAKLCLIAALVVADFTAIAAGFAFGWNRDPEGSVLYAALAGVAILLMREAEQVDAVFERFMDGGDAEVLTSNELHTLGDAWNVRDNWLRPDRRGNVDHIVRRPDGAWFAIETKSYRFGYREAAQAVGSAVAVKHAFRLRWVVPVLCVDDPTQATEQRVVGRARVWVVDRRRIAAWLREAPV